MLFADLFRCDIILTAKGGGVTCGDAHLPTCLHDTGAAKSDVRATEAPSCHHEVADVSGVEAAEGDVVFASRVVKQRFGKER